MQYLLLFHSNNDYTNAPQCYVDTYTACLVTEFLLFPVGTLLIV